MNTIQELQDEYSNCEFTEIRDEIAARDLFKSKSASTWGAGPIAKTGWYQLAYISGGLDNKPTILVCPVELIASLVTR